MKKNSIKYLIYIFSIQFLLVSCNENETAVDFNFTGNISLSTSSITLFDDDSDVTLTFSPTEVKPDVTLQSVDILKGFPNGTATGTATVTGNTAIFSTSIFKPLFSKDRTGNLEFEAIANLSDGTSLSRVFTISVSRAGSISIEGTDAGTLTKIPYQSPDSIYVVMINNSVDHKNATELLEWKKSKMGSYVTDGFTFNNSANDTLKLMNSNTIFDRYSAMIGDTIYLRYILDNSITKDTLSSKIAIVSQLMGDSKTVAMGSSDVISYNLISGDTSNPEITYEFPRTIKGTASSGIMFVKSSLTTTENETLFDSGDLFDTKNQFDSGTKTTDLSNVDTNDYYSYSVERDGKIYYGLLKIVSLTDPGKTFEKINIEFKEGKFL